ncbi:hypothetical protein [Streptomyces sp. AN091965]|uniref:hypothetical protein n=1 Tax=Streptomyces sp. AN091965 TaxID=2927803 RepID=UPI001F60187D|nr:hypothetical protein [Streptomyces sp. AN091965]MCI3929208.1 hypothetical protein [Streptomyces sp. AN091965]
MAQTHRPSVARGHWRGVEQLKIWLRSHSADWQFAAGAAVAFPPVILQLVMVLIGSPVGSFIGLGVLSFASTASSWLFRPWFEGLARKEQRRITAAPLAWYLALALLFTLCSVSLAPQERGVASMFLILVWISHSLCGSGFEPSSFAYERLAGRLRRAAPVRVIVIWVGIAGLYCLLQYVREKNEYRAVVFGVTVTIGLAGVAASLKVFARVRRLCTSLDRQADELILALEKLRVLPDDQRPEQQLAVEQSWRELRRVLANKVDTGFSISGVFVLPRETIRELQTQVHRAMRASGADFAAHRTVVARLRVLRMACVGRIDTLA